MRNSFVNKICSISKNKSNLFLVSGDLGFGVLDEFRNKYPNRFINVGICEQNMTAVAAGIALEDNLVITYSIANFPTMRCLEQIRNDICYHEANVKVVAVGGGFAYGALGMTHHGTEDIAIMRALPKMKIFVPCDPYTAEVIAKYIVNDKGPSYIRLERGGEPVLFNNRDIDIEKIQEIRRGQKIAIIAIGSILNEAIKAAVELQDKDIYVGVYYVIMLKPIDVEGILKLCNEYDVIITLEEHSTIGGLGSTISEIVAENDSRVKVIRLGLKDVFSSIVGDQIYLRSIYKLDYKSIKNIIESNLLC